VSVDKNEAMSGITNCEESEEHKNDCLREGNKAKTRRILNRNEVVNGITICEEKRERVTNYSSPAVLDEGVGTSEEKSQLEHLGRLRV
jgi:hypothetical protein